MFILADQTQGTKLPARFLLALPALFGMQFPHPHPTHVAVPVKNCVVDLAYIGNSRLSVAARQGRIDFIKPNIKT